MKSLRNRFALLLIVAIVTVVGLATFAAVRALRPPLLEAAMEPVARQLQLIARLAEADRARAEALGVVLEDAPRGGVQLAGMSGFLRQALEQTGPARTVVVTRGAGEAVATASVQLGPADWLIADVPALGPAPDGGWVVAGWSALIILGSTAVSLFAASKIVKPLQLLEESIGRISSDGVLQPIPEVGSSEVRATAHALNTLSSRLKSAMESRMRLVAAAGHDLRTPMTRMRLRAEFIADEEERAKWLADLEELDAIADSAIRLVREEVVSASRETVSLAPLVGEVVEELAQLGYRVRPPAAVPLTVAGAPLALKRALRNLMINAATHGGGAEVTLSRDGDWAVVWIRDNGPGIPENLLEHVFEPFFRVDAARRKTIPGAGLGLAIAQGIIERSGGSIAVENVEEPRGLLQIVRLPLLRVSDAAVRTAPPPTPDLHGASDASH